MRRAALAVGTALILLPTIAGLVPQAVAQPNPLNDERYLFTGSTAAPGEERIDVEVTYTDGLASTKFAFNQFEGEQETSEGRLDPGAECTDWIGTFTQVQIEAESDDAVQAASAQLENYVFPPEPTGPILGDGFQEGEGFIFEAVGNVGVFEGTLTICDDPGDTGLAKFVGTVEELPFADSNLGTVRFIVEDA